MQILRNSYSVIKSLPETNKNWNSSASKMDSKKVSLKSQKPWKNLSKNTLVISTMLIELLMKRTEKWSKCQIISKKSQENDNFYFLL